MGMIGMGIRRVMVVLVAVAMIVAVVMTVAVTMVVMVMMALAFKPAQPRTKGVAKLAFIHVRSGRIGALAFNMVMMAFLNRTNLAFKAQNLGAIFAHRAIGRRHLAYKFGHPFGKGL